MKGTLQDFQSKHPTTAELIVEIADSSLFEDTTTKAEENRLLLIFRDPAPLPEGGLAYRTCLKLKETDSASPLALPTAAIRIGDLLGDKSVNVLLANSALSSGFHGIWTGRVL